MLQSQALAVASSLGNNKFKASSGWLDSFKKRHNIVWNEICGESKDVDQSVVQEWKPKLQSLISDYEPRNIFNADKTGLFFRALPSKSLVRKGESCAGGKMSKERLTVLICANMAGELEKPLVIGKLAKPRCFKNMNVNNLPVVRRNNKKARMTSALMEEWLNAFNSKMKKEKRKVIMFLDNATCHPNLKHSHVKLAFFPPNTTSVLQPMDMGVIYTFKSCYRRLLMQSLMANIETADSSYTLAKSVSVLDAVNWIGLAGNQIKVETIMKCFNKAGFGKEDGADAMVEARENSVAISALCHKKNLPGDAEHLISTDETHSTFESATDLLAIKNKDKVEEKEEVDDDECEEQSVPLKIRTHEQAVESISDIMQFAIDKNNPRLLELVYSIKDCIEKDMAMKQWKQVSLLDIWKKN